MRYIFGVIFIFFGVFLAIYFGLKLFRGSSSKPAATVPAIVLSDYAGKGVNVSVTIDGPVVGNEDHRAVRITVSKDTRTVDVIKGYSGVVISTKSYDNTPAAFDVFLRAIGQYGFTNSRSVKNDDDRGVCPTGDRYIYQLSGTGNKSTDRRLWGASCGTGFGNFAGTGPAIRDLFQKQIPDYAAITGDVQL